jgi:hypothetical protein
MNLQYISDNSGHTTAVVIPIEEWNALKKKYKEFEQEEMKDFIVPDWQTELIKKELKHVSQGDTELMAWEEAKKQFKL